MPARDSILAVACSPRGEDMSGVRLVNLLGGAGPDGGIALGLVPELFGMGEGFGADGSQVDQPADGGGHYFSQKSAVYMQDGAGGSLENSMPAQQAGQTEHAKYDFPKRALGIFTVKAIQKPKWPCGEGKRRKHAERSKDGENTWPNFFHREGTR